MLNDLNVGCVAAERLQVVVGRQVKKKDLYGFRGQPEVLLDATVEELYFRLFTHLRVLPGTTVTWPATWWEAVKERFFPARWKKLWPVKYAEKALFAAICPHQGMSGDSECHLWLFEQGEDESAPR